MTIEAIGRRPADSPPSNIAKEAAQKSATTASDSAAETQRKADGGDVAAQRRIAKEAAQDQANAAADNGGASTKEKGFEISTVA